MRYRYSLKVKVVAMLIALVFALSMPLTAFGQADEPFPAQQEGESAIEGQGQVTESFEDGALVGSDKNGEDEEPTTTDQEPTVSEAPEGDESSENGGNTVAATSGAGVAGGKEATKDSPSTRAPEDKTSLTVSINWQVMIMMR